MIPILFRADETTFTTNGIGRLYDSTKCVVTEEYNGQYELAMNYSAEGKYFGEIATNRIIYAKPSDGKSNQPFRIYRITKPLDGIITIYARHITYDLDGIPVKPFSTTGITRTLNGLIENSMLVHGFSVWTDISNDQSPYSQSEPASFRSRLGGVSGSVLDVFGGEYEWDNFTVKLHAHRGTDAGVCIRYGRNLTDLKQEETIENTYTGVLAYWKPQDGDTVYGNICYIDGYQNYPKQRIFILDQSSEYSNEQPTKDRLTRDAEVYVLKNNIGVPRVNISVSFAALWQTEQYKSIAPLERVNLCDTIHVYFEKLGVSASAKVIRTEYDVLKERYVSIEIGDAKANLKDTITNAASEAILPQVTSTVQSHVDHATELLSGGLGGHIVLNRNEEGQPNELLFLDTNSIETAVNVWRYNANGWGVSHNGYNGPYEMAATIDGGFVADFITTGTLNADRIKIGNRTLTETMDEISETVEKTYRSIDTYYLVNDGTTPDPNDEAWSLLPPERLPNQHIWMMEVKETFDGTIEKSNPVDITGANGKDGEDATLLRIDSSRGNVFKNNAVSTVLSVVVFHGSDRITNSTKLKQVYGSSAYLEWKWKRINDSDFKTISSSDSRLSNDGFSFTLSPEDVDTKVVFECSLIA